MSDRILDALGVADDASRVDRLVAVVAACVRDCFDVDLDDARVPVEEEADRHLRRPTGPDPLAHFAADLALRVADRFADRVTEGLIFEVAERHDSYQLFRNAKGLRDLGLSVEGTRYQVAVDVVYDAVNFAVDRYWRDEEKAPPSGASREAGWLESPNGAGP